MCVRLVGVLILVLGVDLVISIVMCLLCYSVCSCLSCLVCLIGVCVSDG